MPHDLAEVEEEVMRRIRYTHEKSLNEQFRNFTKEEIKDFFRERGHKINARLCVCCEKVINIEDEMCLKCEDEYNKKEMKSLKLKTFSPSGIPVMLW